MPTVSVIVSDSDNDQNTGVKQWATVSPKLSGISGDPDYKGTTVGTVV